MIAIRNIIDVQHNVYIITSSIYESHTIPTTNTLCSRWSPTSEAKAYQAAITSEAVGTDGAD